MAKKPQSKSSTEVTFDHELLRTILAATNAEGFMYVDPAKLGQLIKAGVVELNAEMTNEQGHVATRPTEKGFNYFPPIHSFNANATPIKETAPMKHETVNVKEAYEAAEEAVDEAADAVAKFAFEIDSDVPQPKHTRGSGAGRKFTYPFELLEVGQSFHIPATDDCKEPHKARASLISLANNRYAKDTGEHETVEVNTYAVDAKGKRLKNADGSFVKTGTKHVSRPKKVYSRRFSIHQVDHSDKRGAGARVFRTA